MLESFMLIALGFLTATLFALIAVQLAWRRAVTVTTRKLTSELDLDDLKLKAERASLLDVNLQDKQEEISALIARNARLEETLTTAQADAQTLKSDVADLQSRHGAALAEAQKHLQSFTDLQVRFNELEAAARSEMEKRGMVEGQLMALGEKANRLIADMSAVAAQIGETKDMIAAEPEIDPQTDERQTTAAAAPALTPYMDEDDDPLLGDGIGEDLAELAEIKAALDGLGTGESGPATTEPADDAAPTDGFIADRIRALKAGVSASA
jgi:DNA repair exonuclease SbcCD ATPase subunit